MDNEVRLWCMILGEHVNRPLFRLTMCVDDTVSKLKESEVIRRKVPRYNTKRPLFYKLDKPMPIAPEDNLQQRIENEEKIENCAKLLAEPGDDLGDLFPKSDEVGYHRLHVIVKFPVVMINHLAQKLVHKVQFQDGSLELKEIGRISLIRDFRFLFDDFSTTSSLYSGFEMSPKDDQHLLAEAQIAAVSPWALDNLSKGQQADVSYNAYRSIMKAPKMGILRGQMFERQVLKFFASLKENTPFCIRSLDDSTTSHWVYPGPTSCSSFHPLTVIQLLEVAVMLKKPLCLTMPNPLNFPAVASILYDPSQGFTGIQITSQTTHPVAVMGFKQIQKWYSRLAVGLGSSIPLGNRWRFIFVVPGDIAANFTKQPLGGGGGTDNQEWWKSVDQYVLGLKEDTIWLKI